MRVDHHAYQRATRVAGFGFLLQAGIGITFLLFGLIAGDTSFVFASSYILIGLSTWLGLIVIFYQHKLERLEALEEDELASSRGGDFDSLFEEGAEETRVAARRLRLMHKWMMPGISLVIVAAMAIVGWRQWAFMGRLGAAGETGVDLLITDLTGWALAICLAFALVSFIFSRFVAGMSKQAAWQNLRGGAGHMVGNALVLMAVGVGLSCQFFLEEDSGRQVVEAIAYGMPFFMWLLTFEVVANFILNLYRPRIPGEVPRPAFDSKALSMLAAPDNLVRSINQAVDYQFGFDITSSWGYQLLLRSVAWLVGLGVLVLVALNMLVVVEPHQQAVKLAGGSIVGEPGSQVYGSGVMWKLPWPLQSAQVVDVTRIRSLPLTARRIPPQVERGVMWSEELVAISEEFRPFIVGASTLTDRSDAGSISSAGNRGAPIALVDAEIRMQYRIRQDGGLLDYLTFAPEHRARGAELADREEALQRLALDEISERLAAMSIDRVLSEQATSLASDLRAAVQSSMDDHKTGIQVLAIDLLVLRPSSDSIGSFEDLPISRQVRQQVVAEARQKVENQMTAILGDAALLDPILEAIEAWDATRRSESTDDAEHQRLVDEARLNVERLLMQGDGIAAQTIAEAERDRWVLLMEKHAMASRTANQLAAYRAAPRLYRQREIMRIFSQKLPTLRKIVLGIDPDLLNMDIDMHELNAAFNFADAIGEDGGE